ncbi:Antibiotic biosynthesis monooxygenase [Phocaeicola vulgatus]|nr:Antibiotic biosynthesis monooxygenase [Phocaeicola vulgatus]
MIRLNVFIQVNESNRNAVLETAKELVAQSLNDKGCIAYDIFESGDTERCPYDLRNMERC